MFWFGLESDLIFKGARVCLGKKAILFSAFPKSQMSGWKLLITVYPKSSLEKFDHLYFFLLASCHSTVRDSN